VSITNRTPGTVTEVSAIFVARITFLVPWGVIAKALYCRFGGRAAYNGHTSNYPMSDHSKRSLLCLYFSGVPF